MQPAPRRIHADEGHAGEAKEARRIGAPGETLGEARRDEVEILLGHGFGAGLLITRKMQRLPLRRPLCPIVAAAPVGDGMVMIVPVIVCMIMIVIEMHGSPLTC
jgi:hypothetical protein